MSTSATADGFETTFAVNHLAHHLPLRLLLPALRDGALVVLTTSGTYDPATRAGLTPPRHADADLLAHPDRDPGLDPRPRKAGEHACTASKLCAVLTALSLSRLPDRRLAALAYDPGQVFGTGLAKDLPLPLRTAWSLFGIARPPSGQVIASLRNGQLTWPEVSELARGDGVARALWDDSGRLVGLPAG